MTSNFDTDLDEDAIGLWLKDNLPALEEYVVKALGNSVILIDPAAND